MTQLCMQLPNLTFDKTNCKNLNCCTKCSNLIWEESNLTIKKIRFDEIREKSSKGWICYSLEVLTCVEKVQPLRFNIIWLLHFSFLHLFKWGDIVWLQMTWPITVRLWYISKPGGDLSINVSCHQFLRVTVLSKSKGFLFELSKNICHPLDNIKFKASKSPFPWTWVSVEHQLWTKCCGWRRQGNWIRPQGLLQTRCGRGLLTTLQLFKDFYAGP